MTTSSDLASALHGSSLSNNSGYRGISDLAGLANTQQFGLGVSRYDYFRQQAVLGEMIRAQQASAALLDQTAKDAYLTELQRRALS